MENGGIRRRERVIALWIREKRKSGEGEGREGGSERVEKIETDRRKRVSGRGRKRRRERHIEERGDAKGKEAGPAERLTFIPDQLHFQPSSEYKRQFNYRGIFKGGSSPTSRLSPSLPLPVFTSAPSSPSFVAPSVDGISLKVRRQENLIHAHTLSCLRILVTAPMCTSLDDIS